ncbi:hypothetical protein Taro_049290, partial [Colocasia esculenta]|nr:hypothetical protein [Colocasia esculenta]
MDKSNGIFREGPIIDGATQYLLEENVQVLSQIKVNLDSLKLQDNVDLFFHAKNNIDAILRRMSEMPGLMSQMLALPISINEELAGAILSRPQVVAQVFCIVIMILCSCKHPCK